MRVLLKKKKNCVKFIPLHPYLDNQKCQAETTFRTQYCIGIVNGLSLGDVPDYCLVHERNGMAKKVFRSRILKIY